MQTYSHVILTAALSQPVEKWEQASPGTLPPLHTRALLIGSFLPDVMLVAISVVVIFIDWWRGVFNNPAFANMQPGSATPPELLDLSLTMRLFDVWFFENPWVIAAQNTFHSPLILSLLIVTGYVQWKAGRGWGQPLFWMMCAAMLHTLIDIPLHVEDGPLYLFPFNWELRYRAPISYWDPRSGGVAWSIFEHVLDLVLLIWLVWRKRDWFTKQRNRRLKANAQP